MNLNKVFKIVDSNDTIREMAKLPNDSPEYLKLKRKLRNSAWAEDDIQTSIDKELERISARKAFELANKKEKADSAWNTKKYDKWLNQFEDDGTIAENAYDYARNAEHEEGLLEFIRRKISREGGDEKPLERIQWDLESIYS